MQWKLVGKLPPQFSLSLPLAEMAVHQQYLYLYVARSDSNTGIFRASLKSSKRSTHPVLRCERVVIPGPPHQLIQSLCFEGEKMYCALICGFRGDLFVYVIGLRLKKHVFERAIPGPSLIENRMNLQSIRIYLPVETILVLTGETVDRSPLVFALDTAQPSAVWVKCPPPTHSAVLRGRFGAFCVRSARGVKPLSLLKLDVSACVSGHSPPCSDTWSEIVLPGLYGDVGLVLATPGNVTLFMRALQSSQKKGALHHVDVSREAWTILPNIDEGTIRSLGRERNTLVAVNCCDEVFVLDLPQ